MFATFTHSDGIGRGYSPRAKMEEKVWIGMESEETMISEFIARWSESGR